MDPKQLGNRSNALRKVHDETLVIAPTTMNFRRLLVQASLIC